MVACTCTIGILNRPVLGALAGRKGMVACKGIVGRYSLVLVLLFY